MAKKTTEQEPNMIETFKEFKDTKQTTSRRFSVSG